MDFDRCCVGLPHHCSFHIPLVRRQTNTHTHTQFFPSLLIVTSGIEEVKPCRAASSWLLISFHKCIHMSSGMSQWLFEETCASSMSERREIPAAAFSFIFLPITYIIGILQYLPLKSLIVVRHTEGPLDSFVFDIITTCAIREVNQRKQYSTEVMRSDCFECQKEGDCVQSL